MEETRDCIGLGVREALPIYLNGICPAPSVYAENYIDDLIEQRWKDVGCAGEVQWYWHGVEEKAPYFFEYSSELMRQQTRSTVAHHPLCERARVAQVV